MLILKPASLVGVLLFADILFLFQSARSNELLESSLLSLTKQFARNMVFCNDFFLPKSIEDPLYELKGKVYGQPFVTKFLLRVLSTHFEVDGIKRPDRPVALRFHGPSGVGKTFVANHIFESGYFKNKHFIPMHFKRTSSLRKYKENIRELIEVSIKSCKRSIFVFDDITSVGPEFFEDLPPFKISTSSLNYKEALFIYISQNDSDTIISTTTQFLNEGIHRHGINISTFLESMSYSFGSGIFQKFIGFFKSLSGNAPQKDYIDLYIPFLPLERSHVTKCIEDDVGKSSHVIEDVLRDIKCPPGTQFCPNGCKSVHSKAFIALREHEEL